MLASHRDQENLVRTQVPTKQAPKTPGSRYPKTPLKIGGDENADRLFTKGGRIGNEKVGLEKLHNRQLMTPAVNTVRAPLGNKTTNAKATRGQVTGGKGLGNVEKSQVKPVTTQKHRPKITSAPPLFEVQPDVREEGLAEEPEYAPAKAPRALAYKSDVLPENGLTFKGLQHKHLLSGYFEHFYNDVDSNGQSRSDRILQSEKYKAIDQIEKQNAFDVGTMNWNLADAEDITGPAIRKRPERKAVVDNHKLIKRSISPSAARPKPASATTTKPTVNNISVSAHNRSRSVHSSIADKSGNASISAGEVASRNSLGYRTGRAVSSILQPTVRSKPKSQLATSQTADDRDIAWKGGLRVRTAMDLNHELMNTLCDDDSDIELLGIPALSLQLDDGLDDEDFQLDFDL